MEVLAKEQNMTLSELSNDAWEDLWAAAKKSVG
jgi:hypothetical protein